MQIKCPAVQTRSSVKNNSKRFIFNRIVQDGLWRNSLPIQMLGTANPTLLKLWAHVIMLYKVLRWSWLLEGCGVCSSAFSSNMDYGPPIQTLETTGVNLLAPLTLRLSAHIMWCSTRCFDHPSCNHTTTTHPDIWNHVSKPAETSSPCDIMLYNVFESPQLIFLGGCGVYWWWHPHSPTHPHVGNYWSKPAETFWPCYMMP